MLASLVRADRWPKPPGRLIAGFDEADDAAIVETGPGTALVLTTDFFAPVVDDPYDWGRIAATNALSDVYAVGGTPVFAVNLLGWPRAALPMELAAEVLRGGLDVTHAADCFLAGGHSVDAAEPMYGLAVTGMVDPARTLRIDADRAGVPLSITKPLGIGVLNTRHKQTGEVFAQAVDAMTTLNRDAADRALAAGVTCATDVTGFGLLGHLLRLVRASGVSAMIDAPPCPYLDGARSSGRGRVRQRRRARATSTGCARTPTSTAVDDLTAISSPTRRPAAGSSSPVRSTAAP